jgi:mutator protein MutT
MGNTTLLFLIKKKGNEISHVCLARKKRSFGMGRWNGVGGKLLPGESVEKGLIREAEEEIGIIAKSLSKIAELNFTFSHKSEWNQITHVYFCENWENEPEESEEMNPKWFSIENLPFGEMWPDDIFWLPKVIKGELIKGNFIFGNNDVILEQKVESVESF